MKLVLYQPDIPQNVGAAIRLGACLGVAIEIVEPCGFVFDERRLRRAGLDYRSLANVTRHSSWEAFMSAGGGRLILLSTKGDVSHHNFRYRLDDRLMLGRESSGVPDSVASTADAVVRIPLQPEARSLNVVTAGAIVLGEALRQTDSWPISTAETKRPL